MGKYAFGKVSHDARKDLAILTDWLNNSRDLSELVDLVFWDVAHLVRDALKGLADGLLGQSLI